MAHSVRIFDGSSVMDRLLKMQSSLRAAMSKLGILLAGNSVLHQKRQ